MILITGAAGKTGRAVTAAVARRGAAVRAFVRRPAQREAVLAAGAAEVVVGDMRRPADVAAAMDGVRAVYHMAPNMHPDEQTMGQAVIEAARAAGVTHLVYHSVLHPQTEEMPHHWRKLRVEERLLASGLPFTILQPAAYMQNILGGWASITERGEYVVPYPADTRLSLVDLEDVAAAAALVLTEPGHVGATYELVGTEPLAQDEVAAALCRALGRPVRVREQSHGEWRRGAETAGMPAATVEALLKMFTYYARYGFVGNPRALTWLLGRPPTTLDQFLQRAVGVGCANAGEE